MPLDGLKRAAGPFDVHSEPRRRRRSTSSGCLHPRWPLRACRGGAAAQAAPSRQQLAGDLTSAAKRAGDQGLWQQVLQLLEDAGEMQLAPDMILYGAVMSACEKNHQWQQALGIFHQLRKPSLVATSIAISALGRGSLWASALQLQMELPQPNVITYNATISACERGQQWSVALALLDRMPTRKVSPDIISFNAAINACEKAEEWQRALQAFDAMTIEANEITYNTVMSACHKGSHWHLALTLFNSMSSRQLAPTPVSHSAAMAACLRGEMPGKEPWASTCGCRPRVTTPCCGAWVWTRCFALGPGSPRFHCCNQSGTTQIGNASMQPSGPGSSPATGEAAYSSWKCLQSSQPAK
ncbi:unnamed protein product [Effrenium voratum]|uniref:Pentatricopeptide repeat-containing protein n=1 Tax=Effrenium voratum TaxID=2562239 RepID=A0AA36JC44_9DINO|nr:unnamed protein product [Effrenium voratum]